MMISMKGILICHYVELHEPNFYFISITLSMISMYVCMFNKVIDMSISMHQYRCLADISMYEHKPHMKQ